LNAASRGRAGQRGVTLVELMVALLLGVLLSAAAVSAYLGSKRHYVYERQLARIQENGRYAKRLLAAELQMAGFYGGLLDTADLEPAAVGVDCSDAEWALHPAVPLDLVDDHSAASAPLSLSATRYTCIDGAAVRPGTDLLAIKRTAAAPSMLRGQVADELTAADSDAWFLRTLDGADPAWLSVPPAALLSAGMADPAASYWEAVARIFFVRRYAREPGDGIPALCMALLAGNAMTTRCLVEGVENLQLELGIDTDTDGIANRYVQNPAPAELGRAVTARVHLLLRSLTPLPGYRDSGTYRLGQHDLPAVPPDGHMRRVFSTTIRLHNLRSPLT